LPPVSRFRPKLIRRRLERDFANSEIRGAILLGREQTGRKDWNFMMVALEKSRSFRYGSISYWNCPIAFMHLSGAG